MKKNKKPKIRVSVGLLNDEKVYIAIAEKFRFHSHNPIEFCGGLLNETKGGKKMEVVFSDPSLEEMYGNFCTLIMSADAALNNERDQYVIVDWVGEELEEAA